MTGTDPRAVFERHGAFRVWRLATAEAKALLGQLLPDPDRLFAQGSELPSPWRGEATDKVRLLLGGQEYFLKRYNCGGWPYQLKNAFRPSKALRSWRVVRHFVERRVPTPLPLLCVEERRLRLLARSYLLYPFVAGEAASFLDLWPRLGADERYNCLERLAELIGRMHRLGLLHGDLNWRNILAAGDGESFRFWLVDLDGSRLMRRPALQLAEKDLNHFLRDLGRAGAGHDFHYFFLDNWKREMESVAS